MKYTFVLLLLFIAVLHSCDNSEETLPESLTFLDTESGLIPNVFLDNPDVVKITECEEEVIINTHNVEGYVDKRSYFPGEKIKFFIHCPSETFRIDLCSSDIENTVLDSAKLIKGEIQNYTACSYKYGCNWNLSYEYTIPSNWNSGIYSAEIKEEDNTTFQISFIVKNPKPESAKLLVVASTNTWQAYNPWGGASYYKYDFESNPDSLDCATVLSFLRPNKRAGIRGGNGFEHLADGEVHITRWLAENSYDFDLICDEDLHESEIDFNSYNTVILSTHCEYYTKEMYDHLEKFVGLGGNLCYLAGNGLYWKVTINNAYQMEFQPEKDIHAQTGEQGGNWRDLNRPESGLLGVEYSYDGYDTYAGYKVIESEHWIFTNTGLKPGDVIGKGSSTVEAASGHETDKMTPFSPENCMLLAKGVNKKGGAEMIYYETDNGAKVFSVGSITFGRNLAIDENLSQILKNVLDNFLAD